MAFLRTHQEFDFPPATPLLALTLQPKPWAPHTWMEKADGAVSWDELEDSQAGASQLPLTTSLLLHLEFPSLNSWATLFPNHLTETKTPLKSSFHALE